MVKMGIGLLGFSQSCLKRKFRWFMRIQGISELEGTSTDVFMPYKAARPSIEFKEIEAQHLNETVYYAGKPAWKPIQLTLYEHDTNAHPVLNWIKRKYNPREGGWCVENTFKIPTVWLELYDGCGTPIEVWKLENVWPQVVDFGDLEMGNSEVVTCDLTLRYDRADIVYIGEENEFACYN